MKIKFTSVFIAICILLSQLTAFAALPWPAPSSNGRDLPNRPTDGYVSMQNPPAFTWKYVREAVSYELCIYTDENCSKKKYSKTGLINNYYNFSEPFEAGKTYWWRVRYYTEDGSALTRMPMCSPFPKQMCSNPVCIRITPELLPRRMNSKISATLKIKALIP